LSITTAALLVEADVAAVLAERRLLRADDDAADDLALLHLAAGERLLHGADDHVADVGDLRLNLPGCSSRRAP
jgi:hypothetical protein